MGFLNSFDITQDEFKQLYDQFNGFDNIFNKNHPGYEDSEDGFDFILAGSKSIVDENNELIKSILVSEG